MGRCDSWTDVPRRAPQTLAGSITPRRGGRVPTSCARVSSVRLAKCDRRLPPRRWFRRRGVRGGTRTARGYRARRSGPASTGSKPRSRISRSATSTESNCRSVAGSFRSLRRHQATVADYSSVAASFVSASTSRGSVRSSAMSAASPLTCRARRFALSVSSIDAAFPLSCGKRASGRHHFAQTPHSHRMSTVHHSISRSSPQCGQRPSHRVSPTSEGLGRSVSERVRPLG